MSSSPKKSEQISEAEGPQPSSTGSKTVNIETLNFEGLVIDIAATAEGYMEIATQDMHCANTRDRETYTAGFGNVPANDRAPKLAQQLRDIALALPK